MGGICRDLETNSVRRRGAPTVQEAAFVVIQRQKCGPVRRSGALQQAKPAPARVIWQQFARRAEKTQ
jgi:hypothetical protein